MQWKLEIGGSAQRSKGAHLGGADLWTELYSLAIFPFFYFVLIYGCPSPIAMEYFLFVSYFVKAKQEMSKNYIL